MTGCAVKCDTVVASTHSSLLTKSHSHWSYSSSNLSIIFDILNMSLLGLTLGGGGGGLRFVVFDVAAKVIDALFMLFDAWRLIYNRVYLELKISIFFVRLKIFFHLSIALIWWSTVSSPIAIISFCQRNRWLQSSSPPTTCGNWYDTISLTWYWFPRIKCNRVLGILIIQCSPFV